MDKEYAIMEGFMEEIESTNVFVICNRFFGVAVLSGKEEKWITYPNLGDEKHIKALLAEFGAHEHCDSDEPRLFMLTLEDDQLVQSEELPSFLITAELP